MIEFLGRVLGDVAATVAKNWPFLGISILAAAAVTTYVGAERLEALLRRKVWLGIAGAVVLAVLTPFCSCGTTAILLGGMASRAPWAPLVAFMVASPLTSPSELALSAGLFGWPFALAFFVGTIVIGLGAGAVTIAVERTGWLVGQARAETPKPAWVAGSRVVPESTAPLAFGPGTASVLELKRRRRDWRLGELGSEILKVGRRLVILFLAFTTIGYVVIEAIPTAWITNYLGSGSIAAIPTAAAIGIPAYINTEASLPLVAALMAGGMGAGPALAFLVTGAGTSIGAITGLLAIARRRVVGLVVAILLVSAILLGWIGALAL
jgi:uncharacterized membrane protein YraQ (UPF0718 family)